MVAGIVCGLAAMCYAELSSTVPVAGSAYTFSYATLGELVAWIIGWDLFLELALAASVVAVGWSQYLTVVLESAGINLPTSIAGEEATVNIPAMCITLALTVVTVLGIKLSSRVTAVIVAIKLAVVLLVIAVGAFYIKATNYSPYIPPAEAAPAKSGLQAPLIETIFGAAPTAFGVAGIFTAAAIVFFAFIGFDIVATAAEETKDPQRDMPRGILGSLAICTVLYVLVATVVVGMQKYSELDTAAPLARAFTAVNLDVIANIIAIGALAGLTSVMLILLIGQSRVVFAMSRDHLLPPALAKVHPQFGTPYRISIIIGVLVTLMAGFIPLAALAELVNIGTLFAFVVVSLGVIILRRTRPDLNRTFRCPGVPVVPILAVLACIYLMLNLPGETWLRFLVWLAIGFIIYFGYSRSRSRVPDQIEREGFVAKEKKPR